MPDDISEPPEFTDEQLLAALERMSREVQHKAFAAGRAVTILKNGSIVAVHADGTEEVLEQLNSTNGSVKE